MSTKRKVIIAILAALIATVITFSIKFIISGIKNNEVVVVETKKIEEKSYMLEIKSDTKTPDQYSAKDALAYTLYKINTTHEFYVETNGESKAMFTTVKIFNRRYVKNDEAFVYCVSKGLISSASERYFSNNNVKYRNTTDVTNELKGNFNEEILEENYDEYVKKYGILPFNSISYIINENTYLEAPSMVKDKEFYKISVKLNPNSVAPYYYKRELITNASATKEPTFKSIELEFLISSDYTLQSVKTKENYGIIAKGFSFFGEVDTTTTYTDTFTYQNIEFPTEIGDLKK